MKINRLNNSQKNFTNSNFCTGVTYFPVIFDSTLNLMTNVVFESFRYTLSLKTLFLASKLESLCFRKKSGVKNFPLTKFIFFMGTNTYYQP